MAKQFPSLEQKHVDFINRQNIFFTASSTSTSKINLSPRSTDSFRILNASSVFYLDRTGSGNETAAHMLADGRLTIMLCSFEGPPQIMRLYGRGRTIHRDDQEFTTLIAEHFDNQPPLGTRQLIMLDIDMVQTSCGFGVPLFDFQGERDTLEKWAENKGESGIKAYWEEKNRESLDGLTTGLFRQTKN